MPYIGPDFPSLRDPNLACGILPGFPIRESYPIENQEELEKTFKSDFDHSRTIVRAALDYLQEKHRPLENTAATPPERGHRVRCIDGSWRYKGVHIFDRGFLLLAASSVLLEFARKYHLPYAIKFEGETDFVSRFEANHAEAERIYIGDLTGRNETLSRIYEGLKCSTELTGYVLQRSGHPMPMTGIGILADFVRNIRQNGLTTPTKDEAIVLNSERTRHEIELLDHPSLKIPSRSSRPSFGHFIRFATAPEPKLPVINDSEASHHYRKKVQVKGTIVDIGVSRRGDIVLYFGAPNPNHTFAGCVNASSGLTTDQAWIDGLAGKTVLITGLIEFYMQKPATRITDKQQVTYEKIATKDPPAFATRKRCGPGRKDHKEEF
jgi:hypothetical protein